MLVISKGSKMSYGTKQGAGIFAFRVLDQGPPLYQKAPPKKIQNHPADLYRSYETLKLSKKTPFVFSKFIYPKLLECIEPIQA